MNKIFRNILIISALALITPFLANAAITCEPNYSEDLVGKPVTFNVYNTDEVGSYTYTWGGDDWTGGTTGDSVTNTYTTADNKNVEVTSDNGIGGTDTATCSVTIYDIADISAPTASCEVEVATAYLLPSPQEVFWTASISGGLAPYTISWGGDDSITGSDERISHFYSATGTMSAMLSSVASRYPELPTLTNQTCSNSVIVYGEEIINENLTDNGTTCSVSKTPAYIDESVTWSVTPSVIGGLAPYTYSWYGTDGLTGEGDSINMAYTTTGIKTALIYGIASSDGQTIDVEINCSNSVEIINRPTGGGSHNNDNDSTNTATSTTSTATSTATSTTDTTGGDSDDENNNGSDNDVNGNGIDDSLEGDDNSDDSEYNVSDDYLFNNDQNPGTYSEDIANLQSRLTEEGFYNGLIGGFFGPATEQALRDYQIANNLPETGILDAATRAILNSRFLGTNSIGNTTGVTQDVTSKISGLTATIFDAFGSAIDFVGGKINIALITILTLLVFGQLYLWLKISKKKE